MGKSFKSFIKDEEAKKRKQNIIQSEEKKVEKVLRKQIEVVDEEVQDVELDTETYLKYVSNAEK